MQVKSIQLLLLNKQRSDPNMQATKNHSHYNQTLKPSKDSFDSTLHSKTKTTENDLSKSLIDINKNYLNLPKSSIIEGGKNNTATRNYFKMYSQIAPQELSNAISKSFTKEINPDDFLHIYPKNFFQGFTIIPQKDIDRVKYTEVFARLSQLRFAEGELKLLDLKLKQSRAIGSMLGLAICDTLGAALEFAPFRRNGYNHNFTNFNELNKLVEEKYIEPKFGQVGIWTDDFAMALSLSYNFILNDFKQNNQQHLRFLFHLWWYHGLCNGNRLESVGLGRNISLSMDEFAQYERRYAQLQREYKKSDKNVKYNPEIINEYVSKQKLERVNQGTKDNNGNGSLMRLAPCAILHYDSVQRAMKLASEQSKTTHNGFEASQCCRLLAKIIVDMINRPSNQGWRQTLLRSCEEFESKLYEVQFLAKSLQQTQELFDIKCKDPNQPRFKQFNRNIRDRKWNWKDKDFDYSPTRFNLNFEYIGSYCMDGLAMALHCVYHTDSFNQCALKCAKMGGDCDTVGAIAGQIAGAIYGVNSQMLKLYSGMNDFKEQRFEAFLVAKKLANKAKVLQMDGCWNWILKKLQQLRRFLYWRSDREMAY